MLSDLFYTLWSYQIFKSVFFRSGMAFMTTYLLIVGQLVRIYRESAMQRPILWLNTAFLSCLIFSLAQHRNWLWGMQIQLWLCLAAAVAGLFILSHRLTTRRVIAAVVLGFVATHSFANGLVYWVVGLLLALLAPASSEPQRRRLLAVWLLFGTLAIFSFFAPVLAGEAFDIGGVSILPECLRHVDVPQCSLCRSVALLRRFSGVGHGPRLEPN